MPCSGEHSDRWRRWSACFWRFRGSCGHRWCCWLLFNVPHLVFRCGGWLIGYLQELRSVELLQRLRLPDAAIWLKEGTAILLGVLCAFLAERGCEHQAIASLWGVVLLPVILLFAWLARRGVTSFSLVIMTTASLLGSGPAALRPKEEDDRKRGIST